LAIASIVRVSLTYSGKLESVVPKVLGVTSRVLVAKPFSNWEVIELWKPCASESNATIAAIPMITPRVVKPARSLRSLIALNE